MKTLKIFKYLPVALSLLIAAGCEDFLQEDSVTDVTTDSYVVNESGLEDLVRSCYPLLREIISVQNKESLVLRGTDIFTGVGWQDAASPTGSPLDMYDVRLNASMGDLATMWDILYQEVSRTNTVLGRAADISFVNPTLKAARVAEAKFLRALSYFYLVQLWGDVPMPLTETKSPNKNVVRVPAADVYTQIIKDLEEAEADLPPTATDYGRATKGAAQFLLARVYLTRGWNYNNSLGGGNADFNTALSWADKVIAAYPLVDEYKKLFPIRDENPLKQYTGAQNARNSEVVFAIQYDDDPLTRGNEISNEPGNGYHSLFGGAAESLPGNNGRTSDYNRHQNKAITTPAMYRLFDPENDTRYHHNFVDAQYALKDAPGYSYSLSDPNLKIDYVKGDTVAYFPPWNKVIAPEKMGIDMGGTKKYTVVTIDQFGKNPTSRLNGMTPLMFKFWEPNIQYGDAYGTFDYALFRSAEAYLIAAEAIVKGATGGALGGADVYYNTVLDRAVGAGVDPECAEHPEDLSSMATVSYRATPGNLTVDMILDERARELMGEFCRWFDLKRTGTLIERTTRMNPWTAKTDKSQLNEHHLVRPIPQHEIDRSSPAISQNDDY